MTGQFRWNDRILHGEFDTFTRTLRLLDDLSAAERNTFLASDPNAPMLVANLSDGRQLTFQVQSHSMPEDIYGLFNCRFLQ
jgi:hypothetical protein